MFPLSVIRHLLTRRQYDAWLRSHPIDPDEFPDADRFKDLRQKARLSRETVCILAGITWPSLVAFEKRRVTNPTSLVRSQSARRLVGALQTLEQDRAQEAQVMA